MDPIHSLNGDVVPTESAWSSRIAERIQLGGCRANAIASPSGLQGCLDGLHTRADCIAVADAT